MLAAYDALASVARQSRRQWGAFCAEAADFGGPPGAM